MKILDRFVDRVTKKGMQTVKEEAKKTVEEAVAENENLMAIGAAALAAIAVYKSMTKQPPKPEYVMMPMDFIIW
jgi:precorrin isomerase